MPHPVPLRLLRSAEPTRSAPARDQASEAAWLTLGGRLCRRAREIGAARRPGHPMPNVTFQRFDSAPKLYEASPSGSAVEAGIVYDFKVDAFGDVVLWRNNRRVPARHKGPLRAAILAAYRAAPATPAEAAK